jgi:PHD/YefM family antitoxin component YafN of YafNO toxin-antitoxin module
MSTDGYHTLDAGNLGTDLAHLHELVVQRRSRIEITRNGCDERCVIISKQELDSLEQALNILAETEGFKSMCDHVTEVATTHGPNGATAVTQ